MRIGVLANCQCQPISEMLRMLPEVAETHSLPIHLNGTVHFENALGKFMEMTQDPQATILTFQVEDKFGKVATSELLKNSRARVLTMTNIYFSGMHPDITYLGGMGVRLLSPVGDYHSKIVVTSFLKGHSPDQCLARFNAAEYERLGYLQEFDRSARELAQRSARLDIDFSTDFVAMARQQPSLYTVNHPTPVVFARYIEVIASALGLRSYSVPKDFLPNFLARSTWWPVYRELADAHALEYQSAEVFRQPDERGGKFMDLKTFVEASYALYKPAKSHIEQSPQARKLMEQMA